ncbi:MAG: single-stranded-DNA-specific exonuclease RecJ [Dehalococcoidia bacterium]|nr:single-stranded-DNA-specific exonuclease RecJ [Dehalococcoidia bacterium]
MAHTHWKLLPDAEKPLLFRGAGSLVSRLLYNRGINDHSSAEIFLKADKRLAIDPFSVPDMHQAVNRVYKALMSGEKIAVYGDFDADGITATALLVQGLSELGGDVVPYIPHRMQEGYGLRIPALEKLRKQGVTLVVTVDTGITAFAEIEKARKMGMEILVTDHHVPLAELPPAGIIVDPKRTDSTCPFKEFAGVGVAFKLMEGLLPGGGHDDLLNSSLELVTLGTITDMSPLISENRYWVKSGLRLLHRTKRIGLVELMRIAGIEQSKLTTDTISYQIGPRLNSAGRLDDAGTSYQLLVTQDHAQARILATELEEKNKERQRLVAETYDKARRQILEDGADRVILMASDADYPPGVIGLVAGRLADEFYRPVILFKIGADSCRGSARSIPEFDLMEALKTCHHLLTKYGGHARAAGFNTHTRDMQQLQKRLRSLAEEQLTGLDLRPHIDIDAEVSLSAFAGGTFEEMRQLEPFGMGNPAPVFLSRKVEVVEQKLVGSQKDHIKLKLKQDGIVWDTMGFRLGNYLGELSRHIDIVYSVEVDNFNGKGQLRLNLLDFTRSY